ncbi:MAG: hypothetical protein LAT84_14670, partial [Balneolia bacterium]|nr:hypothetical protein [Balneolia bacterium]
MKTNLYSLVQTGFLLSVLLLIPVLFISPVQAQQMGINSDNRTNPTSTVSQGVERIYLDSGFSRQQLQHHFSSSEIENMHGISKKIGSEFDIDELQIIMAYESRTLEARTSTENDVIVRYYRFIDELAEKAAQERSYPENSTVLLDQGFYYDSSAYFSVTDNSDSGVVWAQNNRFEDYPASLIADSDTAGENGGQVKTTLQTATLFRGFNTPGSAYLYLSHDYRHNVQSSARVEYRIDGGDWELAAEWTSNNRFANDIIPIPLSSGSNAELRFTYDDGGNWGWWWSIDRVTLVVLPQEPVFTLTKELEDLTHDEFELYSDNLAGVIDGLFFDLSLNGTSGSPWTVGLTLLFVDGDTIDSPVVLQVGGEAPVLNPGEWVDWDSPDGTGPISGQLVFDNSVNLDGLSLFIGHIGNGTGTWDAFIQLVGRSFNSRFKRAFSQAAIAGNGVNVGVYTVPDSPTFWAAEQFSVEGDQYLKGVSLGYITFENNLQGYLLRNQFEGVEIHFYEDDDGVPSGLPGESGEPVFSLSAEQIGENFTVYHQTRSSFRIHVDIEEVLGGQMILDGGTYWMVAQPILNANGSEAALHAFWSEAEAGPANAQFYDPDNFFDIEANEGWVSIPDIITGFGGLALNIYTNGIVPGSDEIDPAPAAGLTASLEDSSGEVELSWMAPVGDGFIESFTGTIRNWETTDSLWEFMDGYMLRTTDPDNPGLVGLAYHEDDFTDFLFEAEMRVEEELGVTGIFFRSDANPNNDTVVDNGYVIIIVILDEIPLLAVFNMVDQEIGGLIRNYNGYEALNEDPYGSNFITVSANGPIVDLFVNGSYLLSFHDSMHGSGKLGVFGGLNLGASVQSSHDYVAAIASPLAARKNAAVVSDSESEMAARSFGATNLMELLNEAIPQKETSGMDSPGGMLSHLQGRGLMAPGESDFVRYEVIRNDVLVGTTTATTFTDVLDGPGTFSYQVRAIYNYGEADLSNTVQVNFTPTSLPEDIYELPASLALSQNYPNPFNPTTQIHYALPEAGEVRLEVFNVNGQRVAVLANGQQAAGRHQVSFDG